MLFLIGVGIDAGAHMTEEARHAIRACSIIYALTPDSEDIAILRKVNPTAEIIDCGSFYEHHSKRPDVYDAIANAVMKSSSGYADVALVVYGHPMFLVSAVEKLLSRAQAESIRCRVVPGISSFDAITAVLQLDLGYGVLVMDATLLLQLQPVLDPRLPLLVFQVANIESDEIERGKISSDRLSTLIRFLRKTYPAQHRCRLVVARRSVFEDGYVLEDTLEGFATNPNIKLSDRPTLYVPVLEG